MANQETKWTGSAIARTEQDLDEVIKEGFMAAEEQ